MNGQTDTHCDFLSSFLSQKDLSCIEEEFVSGAKILEKEAEDRKIMSKELKAAIKFIIDITNRADFTQEEHPDKEPGDIEFIMTVIRQHFTAF